MWPWDPNFSSLYRSFRYSEVRYIGVLPIQIIVILPGPKNYFVLTGTSLYRGLFHRGYTVRRETRGDT